jgi:proteasome lid subunit RPN8/RPN11
MKNELRLLAEIHAKDCYPKESCGLLVETKDQTLYWPCENLATGTDHFIMNPLDYARAEDEGDIKAIVHSHPNAPCNPSQADRVACEKTGLPWYIVSVPEMKWSYLPPEGYTAPLLGRIWCHGVLDCYALVRDFYGQEKHISIPDYDRTDEWWLKGENLYLQNYEQAGFHRVFDEDPQIGDVLLMQINAPVPSHAGVYIGDEKMIHHFSGRLSCREIWGGYFKKVTTHILRYAL